jgi:hypothetical protein
MAADEYWSGPVYDHKGTDNPDYSFKEYQEDIAQIKSDTDRAQLIGRLIYSCRGGGSRIKLEEGQPPAAPELGPRQVIRFVIDSIYSTRGYTPKPKFIKFSLRRDELLNEEKGGEGFDKLTERILNDPLYTGFGAVKTVENNWRKITILERSALYARLSKSGKLYAALDSMYLIDEVDPQEYKLSNLPIAPIGSTYRGHLGQMETLQKVTAADIIEPHGLNWEDPPKGGDEDKKERKRKHSRIWVPRPSIQ